MGETGGMKVHRMPEQPCFALYSAVNAITRAYRPLLQPLDLTYTQYVVMMTLWEEDGVDLRTLAERTLLDPPTLTPVVKRLEAKGLLARRRAEDDERRLVLTVTGEGRRVQAEANEVPEQMLRLVGLTAAEEWQLRVLCGQVTGALASR
ncbi:MarR family winged helix-turn-helix transcriptional regulator [Lentzea sp. NPDC060358]|uniref:MarR family winged helix-turn-helix transcriptional regulator n=1 Tax=Lentzea sp. NPDC060358 TaxID=3347103 RepID=UPI00366218F9